MAHTMDEQTRARKLERVQLRVADHTSRTCMKSPFGAQRLAKVGSHLVFQT